MKKYGVLEDFLKSEFKSIGIFNKQSGIPKSTLSMLINGKYGSDEFEARKRVTEAVKNLRPGLDLSHIWDPSYAWYQRHLLEKSVVKNGFRITVDVKLNEDGGLTIAPIVEGY